MILRKHILSMSRVGLREKINVLTSSKNKMKILFITMFNEN